ncbi:MAG: hypothetical protein KF777_17370 [Planctomycetaceae bacterium]|nr:hypothetical protein [Planctomycetaceae bacterium]
MVRSATALCAALMAIGFTGCDHSDRMPVAKVTGIVLYDGDPLPIGSVLFNPLNGGPTAEANLEADGTFQLGTYEESDGAVLGKHEIIVVAHTFPGGAGLPEEHINANQASVSLIPEYYSDFAKSGLTAEIVKGKNEIKLELSSKEPEKTPAK